MMNRNLSIINNRFLDETWNLNAKKPGRLNSSRANGLASAGCYELVRRKTVERTWPLIHAREYNIRQQHKVLNWLVFPTAFLSFLKDVAQIVTVILYPPPCFVNR
jgi:hypothetical protein